MLDSGIIKIDRTITHLIFPQTISIVINFSITSREDNFFLITYRKFFLFDGILNIKKQSSQKKFKLNVAKLKEKIRNIWYKFYVSKFLMPVKNLYNFYASEIRMFLQICEG